MNRENNSNMVNDGTAANISPAISQPPHLSIPPLDLFNAGTNQPSMSSSFNEGLSDCSAVTITMDTVMTDPDIPVFHLFPKLPVEIRRKIWALNLPGPRLVEVVERNGKFYGCAYSITNFKVCRESRNEALKTHPLSFSVDYEPPLIAFNFEMDTLLLARKLQDEDNHIWFRRHCDERELARVKSLMVDAGLDWKVRTKDDRGSRIFGLSWLVFRGLKDYTSFYTENTDPLPFWANPYWFPRLGSWRWRTNTFNPEKSVTYLQHNWPEERKNRFIIGKARREEFRFGGLREWQKYDPAVKRWSIPRVYSLALDACVIDDFNDSEKSCWAELLMDRAIDCIFD